MISEVDQGAEMPTRGMNDTPEIPAPPETSQTTSAGEMGMRDMNASSQASQPAHGDSPREREKLAAYLREHPEQAGLHASSMPTPKVDSP